MTNGLLKQRKDTWTFTAYGENREGGLCNSLGMITTVHETRWFVEIQTPPVPRLGIATKGKVQVCVQLGV